MDYDYYEECFDLASLLDEIRNNFPHFLNRLSIQEITSLEKSGPDDVYEILERKNIIRDIMRVRKNALAKEGIDVYDAKATRYEDEIVIGYYALPKKEDFYSVEFYETHILN